MRHFTPQRFQVVIDGGFAVDVVGGDRGPGMARAADPLDGACHL
jgi:hypothetical protein